jgi:hypothetical protein
MHLTGVYPQACNISHRRASHGRASYRRAYHGHASYRRYLVGGCPVGVYLMGVQLLGRNWCPETSRFFTTTSLLNRPVYLTRLTAVIENFFGLEPADTTSLWRELLREHLVQYWVTAIDSCIVHTLKALVEDVFPPTPEQLLQLEYQQTDRPGVDLSAVHCSTRKHYTYVYIGSATSPNGVMQLRVN